MNNNFILWTLGSAAVIAFVIVATIQNIKKKLLQTVSELKENKPLFSNSEVGSNLNSFVKSNKY